jgi:hypothetical protein
MDVQEMMVVCKPAKVKYPARAVPRSLAGSRVAVTLQSHQDGSESSAASAFRDWSSSKMDGASGRPV